MTEIDLTPFVSTDPLRAYLHRPFTIGEFTYATNGHVMVRVPRRAGVAAPDKEIAIEKTLADAGDPPMVPFPCVEIPAAPSAAEECDACEGSGYEHDCPDCRCPCDECDGKGLAVPCEKATVGIGHACFQAKYIRLLIALPRLCVPPMPDPLGAMPFTFDGGRGVLMPFSGEWKTHIIAIAPEKVPA